jgi:hypothetical protein
MAWLSEVCHALILFKLKAVMLVFVFVLLCDYYMPIIKGERDGSLYHK